MEGDVRKLIDLHGLQFSPDDVSRFNNYMRYGTSGEGLSVHLVNAHTLLEICRNRELLEILSRNLLIIDGKPLSCLLSIKDRNFVQTRGTDLMRESLLTSSAKNRHFFLGGTTEKLNHLLKAVAVQYPRCSVVGFYSPPFLDDFKVIIDEICEKIKISGANVVWVSLGTPKQDFVSFEIANRLGILAIGVGAAFDYIADKNLECPKYLRTLGLEWLFRLSIEPSRLLYRYAFGNFHFLKLTVPFFIGYSNVCKSGKKDRFD